MRIWGAVGFVGMAACSRSPSKSAPNTVATPVAAERVTAGAETAAPFFASASGALDGGSLGPSPACGDAGDVLVFVSPAYPVRGQTMRVVAVADHAIDARLAVEGGARAEAATSERHGGPPYYWTQTLEAPTAGKWTATLSRGESCGGATLAAKSVAVHAVGPPPTLPPRTSLWWHRSSWSRSFENLYSAWIEAMFEAPLDEQESFSALHDVLRDRNRNFLFDHSGAGEDQQGIVVRPDCADLPYFLRAYFAFKLGLPFGWSRCSRGENGSAPTCSDFATSSDPFPSLDGKAQTFPPWADPQRAAGGPWDEGAKRLGEFFRTTLADAAQSGAGRTAATDDESDYYPIALTAETLRPGTIFADPYGHVLVVAQRVPQTSAAGGVLLAVDGQPDGTVARKRFWRGNFLFAVDPALGSPGFKRFRPIVRDPATRALVRVKNAELPDFSAVDQYAGGVDGFYDKMDDLLSPSPLDPMTALLETLDALEEQVKTRAVSIDNGRRFLASGKPPAEMPDGARIFEANGDWEDFSTPSRDLRLLIAIDVARGLPARVARRPNRYAMPAGATVDGVKAVLDKRLASELESRTFQYTRSDGSPWKLALHDVFGREISLEMAYNPNDCVEQRWGAPAGSQEASTCASHAPDAQLGKMVEVRAWFHERRRPPR